MWTVSEIIAKVHSLRFHTIIYNIEKSSTSKKVTIPPPSPRLKNLTGKYKSVVW